MASNLRAIASNLLRRLWLRRGVLAGASFGDCVKAWWGYVDVAGLVEGCGYTNGCRHVGALALWQSCCFSFSPSDLVGFFGALCGGVWDGGFGALVILLFLIVVNDEGTAHFKSF